MLPWAGGRGVLLVSIILSLARGAGSILISNANSPGKVIADDGLIWLVTCINATFAWGGEGQGQAIF
jgi:hypothetical protein